MLSYHKSNRISTNNKIIKKIKKKKKYNKKQKEKRKKNQSKNQTELRVKSCSYIKFAWCVMCLDSISKTTREIFLCFISIFVCCTSPDHRGKHASSKDLFYFDCKPALFQRTCIKAPPFFFSINFYFVLQFWLFFFTRFVWNYNKQNMDQFHFHTILFQRLQNFQLIILTTFSTWMEITRWSFLKIFFFRFFFFFYATLRVFRNLYFTRKIYFFLWKFSRNSKFIIFLIFFN